LKASEFLEQYDCILEMLSNSLLPENSECEWVAEKYVEPQQTHAYFISTCLEMPTSKFEEIEELKKREYCQFCNRKLVIKFVEKQTEIQ